MSDISLLFINPEKPDTHLKPIIFSSSESDKIKQSILEGINSLGNRAYALIKYNNKYFVCEHKDQYGKSTDYSRRDIKYHPYMKELV